MTKAERIFNTLYSETRKHIQEWGYNPETDGGWSGGFGMENELIYQRTYNEIEKILNSKIKFLEIDRKLGVLTTERRELLEKVYCMMQKSLKNTYICGK